MNDVPRQLSHQIAVPPRERLVSTDKHPAVIAANHILAAARREARAGR